MDFNFLKLRWCNGLLTLGTFIVSFLIHGMLTSKHAFIGIPVPFYAIWGACVDMTCWTFHLHWLIVDIIFWYLLASITCTVKKTKHKKK